MEGGERCVDDVVSFSGVGGTGERSREGEGEGERESGEGGTSSALWFVIPRQTVLVRRAVHLELFDATESDL